MKKITGYLILAALLVLAFSCNKKDEYVPAERESGAQYFFPVSTPLSYTIKEETTGFDITLKRVVKDAASQVVIEVRDTSLTVFPEEYTEVSVNFAAGEDEAKVTLPIDYSKYEFGDKYGLWLSILEETTAYAPSSIHVEIELPEPWVSLGKGTIMEKNFFAQTASVEILQNDLRPNVFRIVAPFDGLYEAIGGKVEDMYERAEYLDLTVGMPGDKVNNVTLTMNGLVFWDEVCTSLYNSSYSAYIYLDHPYEFGSLQSEEAWSHNRVISYQDEGKLIPDTLPAQIQLAPMYYMYGVGAYNYSTADGVFVITFPGVVISDFSTEVEYTGLFNKKDGSIEAMADVTLGEDVDYVKVALVAGDADDPQDPAYDDALALILSEEESEYVFTLKMSDTKSVKVVDEESEEEVTLHVGEARLPMPEDIAEYYSFVVVPFDADGEPQNLDVSYDVFQFKDFGIALTLADPETDAEGKGHITATIDFGEDTEAAFAVLAPGKDDAALYAALNLILSGDDSVVLVTEPGDVTFDIEGEGDFLVMVASYAAGDLWNLDYDFFEYYAVDPWETLGYVQYTDDMWAYQWSAPPVTYWVPVQENINSRGLYRLVNPYHEAYPYNDPGDWDDSKDHHIVIDATNPDAVILERQSTGVDWGYGEIEIESDGAMYYAAGYSYEVIVANLGDIFGKLADNMITFPSDCMSFYMGGRAYYANRNGGFLVDLSDIRETNPDDEVTPAPKPVRKASFRAGNVKTLNVKPAFSKTLKSAAASVAKGNAASRGKSAKLVPMTK